MAKIRNLFIKLDLKRFAKKDKYISNCAPYASRFEELFDVEGYLPRETSPIVSRFQELFDLDDNESTDSQHQYTSQDAGVWGLAILPQVLDELRTYFPNDSFDKKVDEIISSDTVGNEPESTADMTEPRARAARHKGQMNFESECTSLYSSHYYFDNTNDHQYAK
jgi:hypothetical protein